MFHWIFRTLLLAVLATFLPVRLVQAAQSFPPQGVAFFMMHIEQAAGQGCDATISQQSLPVRVSWQTSAQAEIQGWFVVDGTSPGKFYGREASSLQLEYSRSDPALNHGHRLSLRFDEQKISGELNEKAPPDTDQNACALVRARLEASTPGQL